MAIIQVKSEQETIEIHGDFATALRFVKAAPGRRYDAATKTWLVSPAALKALTRAIDGTSGRCVRWTGDEREARARYARGQAAASAARASVEAEQATIRAATDAWLTTSLEAIFPGKSVARLAAIIQDPELGILEAEERGKVAFRDQSQRQRALDVEDEYQRRMSALDMAADDAAWAAEEAALDED